jgi:hypothetical protein
MLDDTQLESSTNTTDETVDNESHESDDEETDEVEAQAETTKEAESEDKSDSEYYKTQAQKYKKLYEDRTEALKRISKAEERKDDVEEENTSTTSTIDVSEAVKKELDTFKKEQSLQMFDDVMQEVAKTDDEREALELIYKNRIQPTGFTRKALLQDLADAKLILDKDKYTAEVRAETEAKVKKNIAEDRAMKNTGGGGSGRRPPESKETLTAEERSFKDAIADYKQRSGLK